MAGSTGPLSTPGTPVVVTGLTASPQFNGRAGVVQGPASKPGRLAVLLHGDAKPTSLRDTNLRKADSAAGEPGAADPEQHGHGPPDHEQCDHEQHAHEHEHDQAEPDPDVPLTPASQASADQSHHV